MTVRRAAFALGGVALLAAPAPALAVWHIAAEGGHWWVAPLALFFVCIALGAIAIPAGVGGGTLFVPIVAGLFPFHLDFVRAAGLLVALAGALSATPSLLRRDLSDLRLGLPLAVLASLGSMGGAWVGFALPPHAVEIALGVTVLAIAVLMAFAPNADFPHVPESHGDLAHRLGIGGRYRDIALDAVVEWRVHRLPVGAALFLLSGFIGGMFGVGAGWANTPVLNLLLGAPLKVATGTSSLVLLVSSATASWVYLASGAVLALVAVPAVAGMMIGARIGVWLLHVLRASVIRKLVLAVLLFAGVRALMTGLSHP